MALSK